MKYWKIDYEPHVRDEITTAFETGQLNEDDIKVIKHWVHEVETEGLPYAQANKDWRDHELIRGRWKGFRAISFSYSGRLIYRVEDHRLVVMVVRVTPDHNFR